MLVLIGLLMGAVLVEGYLRITDYVHKRYPSTNLSDPTQFLLSDLELGWVHTPNVEWDYRMECFKSRIEYNSRGARDAIEHSIPKPDGIYRIVVLGDSMTEALQVNLEKTFPKVLEQLLNEAIITPRFEVINLGVASYGTDQEYLILKLGGLEYQPDLVILAFFASNDIGNNSIEFFSQGMTPKPYFGLEDGELLLLPKPAYQPPQTIVENPGTQQKAKLSELVTGLKLYDWFKGKIYGNPLLYRIFWKFGVVDSVEVPSEYLLYSYRDSIEWEQAWGVTKALIQAISDETKAGGGRFLLVSLPGQVQLASPTAIEWQYPEFHIQDYDFDKPEKIVVEFAEEAGINLLSLLPVFREYLREQGLDYASIHYSCDGHWTPLGHHLAAEAIFKKILNEEFQQQ